VLFALVAVIGLQLGIPKSYPLVPCWPLIVLEILLLVVLVVLEYLYVSITNVLAFSPTDTMPLARWAKGMMAVQSLVAVTTVALVIARAVNVLG
jgi:diacylglycerol kinase